MSDSKGASELIRKLKKKKYVVVPHATGRAKVLVGKKEIIIPGPTQRTSGCAIANAKAKLRREGVDI